MGKRNGIKRQTGLQTLHKKTAKSLKPRVNSGRVCSFWLTIGTCRVTHKRGMKDDIVTTTNETCPVLIFDTDIHLR
jgi:hypothetical protein